MVIKRGTLIFLMMAVVSCVEREQLTFERMPYSGGILKLNGFYYLDDSSGMYVPVYFFFTNGVLVNPESYMPKNFEEIEKKVSQTTFNKKIQQRSTAWGLYKIRNDSIVFEKWYPANGGPSGPRVGLRSGKIINDSTFIITRFKGLDGKKAETLHEVYRFRRTSHKPDSISQFIN